MVGQLDNNNDVLIQLPWTVPQQPIYTTQIQIDPESKKIPLDLNVSSTDWVAVFSFIATIFIVRCSTKAQIKSNLDLVDSQNARLETELEFRNKKLIVQNIIEYSSKLISGQLKLIIKLRDFSVFYGTIDENKKIDRNNHVGQLYQELRDASNQLLQDYHVLELFLLNKGRAIQNLEIKNKLFFNLLWPYLELLLIAPPLRTEKENTTIEEILNHIEYKNVGIELNKILGKDNLTIYLLLVELNRQITKIIKNEIKKAA